MIEVEQLTKYYGPIRGIEDLSFRIDRGDVVGLLGPNGSGKTTTMRILTCFFPPTRGRALVYGYDVVKNPLQVRQHIGYLPERVPLYPDMDIREYLRFAASAKRVDPAKRTAQIDEVMAVCGIADMANRLIGALSKGYRQRVCLAQALLNKPEILILDEPTIGLDPRQVSDFRSLIKNLGRDRTIILCTHILPEVSETCNRVVIIHKGRLIALDTPQNLQEKIQMYGQIYIQYYGNNPRLEGLMAGVPGVVTVEAAEATFSGAGAFNIQVQKDETILRELSALVHTEGGPILEMKKLNLTLEDVFLELVTKEEAK
ncbi:MAG TPA: ATP-binding cassette domain-containing protein [Syntrophales bacterium]|jgi:ABC-2 type transport system ATP-binding protein|nr:ATP-binding cassette domain-containing protein [Syntrophales bacterium]